MNRRLIISAFAAALLMAPAGQLLAMNSPQENKEEKRENQANLAAKAKITKEQAEATALKRAPGKVESSELEREHGRLVYSFDIRNSRGTIDEVQVSAITGKVVRVEHESLKQEAAEKKKEAREKSEKH
ncbi:MAG: hypothetical protein QOH96_3052 [Blastocatellia bacterium]|jgi:uncharacterized membrane protein YkoI|nr:hypothetical protein [Blastocatellia bacterium]